MGKCSGTSASSGTQMVCFGFGACEDLLAASCYLVTLNYYTTGVAARIQALWKDSGEQCCVLDSGVVY